MSSISTGVYFSLFQSKTVYFRLFFWKFHKLMVLVTCKSNCFVTHNKAYALKEKGFSDIMHFACEICISHDLHLAPYTFRTKKVEERMEFDVNRFDEYREDNRLEAKKAKDSLPQNLWDTYSAMANCYGGMILLGVTEDSDGNFSATGISDAVKLQKDFWNTINNRKKVSINLLTDDDVKILQLDGKDILTIQVPRARREEKPVYINDDLMNGTFRRNGEGDYHCTKAEVKAMLRDQTEETADMKILEDMEISDLNAETVHAYRNRHAAYQNDHEIGRAHV